jgi:hypothetical protein
LIFKEHSQEAPCFHRVAASAAEKRNYEEPSGFRQQVFLLPDPPTSLKNPVTAGFPAFLVSLAPRWPQRERREF